MRAVKLDLAAHMPGLKKAGVTHLALEMFGDDVQSALTAYARSRATPEQRRSLSLALEQWGWDRSAYLTLLNAARQNGIQLVALNLPDAQRFTIVFEPGQTELNDTQREMVRKVDQTMAGRLFSLLQAPNAKVLALVGSYHARVLRRAAVFRTISRAVLVPDPASPPDLPLGGLEQALLKNQRTGRRAGPARFLPLPFDLAPFDGAVMLP